MRAALLAALLCAGCASVEATGASVRVHTLGQVAVAVGCPTTARPERGGTAEAGDGVGAAGSPCVSVQGGPISSQLGTVLGTIGGTLAGWLLR